MFQILLIVALLAQVHHSIEPLRAPLNHSAFQVVLAAWYIVDPDVLTDAADKTCHKLDTSISPAVSAAAHTTP